MASLAIGLAGAAIGFATGGAGLPVALGFIGGSILGNALFPNRPDIPRPEIRDLRFQGSEYGKFIPYIHGTDRCDGTVIWEKYPYDSHEVRSETGGKGGGGGDAVTGYTYSTSFAILVCQGPIEAITKIWADGRLVYDGTNPDQFPFTLYKGTTDQLPDPTMEAELGAGNVPGYRGKAYVVFTDMDLSPFGDRIPNLSFLVAKVVTENVHRVTQWLDNFQPMQYGASTPSVSYDGTQLTMWHMAAIPGVSVPVAQPSRQFGHGFLSCIDVYSEHGNIITRAYTESAPNEYTVTGSAAGTAFCSRCRNAPGYMFARVYEGSYERDPIDGRINWGDLWRGGAIVTHSLDQYICTTDFVRSWDGLYFYMLGDTNYVPSGAAKGTAAGGGGVVRKFPVAGIVSGSPIAGYSLGATPSGGDQYDIMIDDDGTIWVVGTKRIVHIRDAGDHFETITDWGATELAAYYSGFGRAAAFCNGVMIWRDDAGVTSPGPGLPTQEDDGRWPARVYDMRSGPPFRELPGISIGVDADTPESTAFFLTALGNGLVMTQDGMVALCTSKGDTITLGEIVTKESTKSEIDDELFEVLELGDEVDGFKIGKQMPARAAIEALMPAYAFKAVESDGIIKYPKLGKGPVCVIDEDDVGAYMAGDTPPPPYKYTRTEESQLPRTVNVTFEDKDFDYQPNSIPESRQSTLATDIINIELPVVIPKQKAREVARNYLSNTWIGRDRIQVPLPQKYGFLDPTDVVSLMGVLYEVQQMDSAPNGPIMFDLMRVIVDGWSGGGSGGEDGESGSGGQGGGGIYKQLTVLEMLDIPLPYSKAEQDVAYPAMCGVDRATWPGAGLLKAPVGGTFSLVTSSSLPDSIGICYDALTPWHGGRFYDEGGTVTVDLFPGAPDLASTTRAGINRGENLALAGQEMLQFRTVTATGTYRRELSGLLRGLNGTEWAVRGHEAGERFVLLPTHARLSMAFNEHGVTREYKAVTKGNAASSALVKTFKSNGVSLAPYAPIHLRIGFNAAGDVVMGWVRRSRLTHAWLDVVDTPLDEDQESYRVQIWTDGTYSTVKRNITVTAPRCVYTVAQQTADWGAPLTSFPAWSVAQIGALGPGYDTLGNLPTYVAAGGGGGGGGGGSGGGGGGTGIPGPVDYLSIMDWATRPVLHSSSVGALYPGSVWSIQFTVRSVPSVDVGHLASFRAAEFGGPPSARIATLSPVKGDFGPQPWFGATSSGSTSVFIPFAVGAGSDNLGIYPIVPLGATWYFNIKTIGSGYEGDLAMICELVQTFDLG